MDHPQTLLTEPAWYPMIDHLRERIQLAMRIERKIRQEIFIEESGVSNFRSFRFNPIQLAGLLCTDIVRLRGLARAPAIDRVYNALVSMESFLACTLQYENAHSPEFAALLRQSIQRNHALFDTTTMASLVDVLAPPHSARNLSQAAANMIPLRPELRHDLNEAKVGLKWVGVVLNEEDVEYSIVVLQCYELPQDIFDGVFKTSGGEHRRAKFPDHRRPLDLRTDGAMDFDSNAPNSPAHSTQEMTPDYGLHPGGFMTIRVENKDLAKTQLVVELQWLAAQMAALSGATLAVNELDVTVPAPVFIDWEMIDFFDLTQKGQEG